MPHDLVMPDQFFDRTKGRVSTFFGNGLVAHVAFAHPVCRRLGDVADDACRAAGATVHRGGTYVCMEGPQFSTLAESKLYRSWGMDIIGMTNLQEAKLAREAEICYATHRARDRLRLLASRARLGDGRHDHRQPGRRTRRPPSRSSPTPWRGCRTRAPASAPARSPHAIITRPETSPSVKRDLAPIIGKYMQTEAADSIGPNEPTTTIMMTTSLSTGSIAFDYLMSFPGKFTEHFLPEHMSRVSLSFLVDSMDKRRGGCAPNIAYTLALLGERPRLMATAGRTSTTTGAGSRPPASTRRSCRQVADKFTASFFCSTDSRTTRLRRSIPARWPTPASCRSAPSRTASWRSSRPNDPAAMVQYAEECRTLGIPLHLGSGSAVRADERRRAARRHGRRLRS